MRIKREDLTALVEALRPTTPGPRLSRAWILGRHLLAEDDKRETEEARNVTALDCPWRMT